VGKLAAEFPTEPGTFYLKDNTQGNKQFGLETRSSKNRELVELKEDFQKTKTGEQLR